jgi:hypothetical protein
LLFFFSFSNRRMIRSFSWCHWRKSGSADADNNRNDTSKCWP